MDEICIHRANPSNNYTVVRNEIFDAGLGVEALGMLTYLISRPANWKVSQHHLRDLFNMGRDRLGRILRELEACGYIVREQRRDPETKAFGKVAYHVYDRPVVADDKGSEPVTDEPSTEKPLTGEPYTVEPDAGEPLTGIRTQTSNKYIKNNNINNTPLPPTADKPGQSPHRQKRSRRKRDCDKLVEPERQQVIVWKDSEPWKAWAATRSRPWPTVDMRDPATGRFKPGWHFPSKWPPGYPQSERSQGGQEGEGG